MNHYKYHTLDVFTRQPYGGNPLAVLPDARGLDAAAMQTITREFNLSETVFVLPAESPGHTFRLRIFTPGMEVAFAGHPTVGTAILLAQIGMVPMAGEETRIVFEEGVGPVAVRIQAGADGLTARLTAAMAPEYGPEPPPAADLAALISLTESDLLGGEWRPEAATCGLPFVFIPVRDRAALARTRLNRVVWERILADFWAPQVFIFSLDPELPGSAVRARMYAPALGIVEDPATGAAASALGGYLGKRLPEAEGEFRWIVEQGFEMGRPSLLDVYAEKSGGEVRRVHVGGAAVQIAEGVLRAPD